MHCDLGKKRGHGSRDDNRNRARATERHHDQEGMKETLQNEISACPQLLLNQQRPMHFIIIIKTRHCQRVFWGKIIYACLLTAAMICWVGYIFTFYYQEGQMELLTCVADIALLKGGRFTGVKLNTCMTFHNMDFNHISDTLYYIIMCRWGRKGHIKEQRVQQVLIFI